MNIEVLLTEAEIAQEFADSLEARDLPEKFFYWLPLSVKAWRDLSVQGEYRELDRTWELINTKAADIVAGFPQDVPIVSLGSGDGGKDRALAHAIQRAGKKVKYFPVDASQTLLETACAGAEDEDLDVAGIKADISSPMHMVLASDAAESPKLFLVAGNTFGGFDPIEQIRHLKETMKGGDVLIIDAELYREGQEEQEAVKAAPFAMGPLLSLGVQEGDGAIRFETRADQRHAGMRMITKNFQAHRDIRLLIAGQEISIARSERVFLNFRYLFTREAFRWLLEQHAGLTVKQEFVSSDAAFTVAVCSCSS